MPIVLPIMSQTAATSMVEANNGKYTQEHKKNWIETICMNVPMFYFNFLLISSQYGNSTFFIWLLPLVRYTMFFFLSFDLYE